MSNLRSASSLLLVCGLIAACEITPNPLPTPAEQCVPEGSGCSVDPDDCCEGSLCWSGPYTPGQGICIPKRPDGQSCGTSVECRSGVCNSEGRCGPETCTTLGSSCSSAGCCAGSFCDRNAYVTTFQTCVAQVADGEFCTFDEECLVGRCTDGRCGLPVCSPVGSECFGFDAPCCEGTVCNIGADSYGPGTCQPRLPIGAPCEVHLQCASESCVDNRCGEVTEPGPMNFSRVFSEILVPNGCTGGYCHGGGAGGLWMGDLEGAYRSLVGQPAVGAGCGEGSRIEPGVVEASILWQKVAPGVPAPCGSKMPPARGQLPAANLLALEAWIRAGAPF